MATIRDVAKAAKVSIKTVSRVINNEPCVSPQTRHAVTEVIKALNYTPSASARRLATKQTRLIALVFGESVYGINRRTSFFAALVQSAALACERHGYDLVVRGHNVSDANNRQRLLKLARSGGVDAVLLSPSARGDEQLVQQLRQAGPLVGLAFNSPPLTGTNVCVSGNNRKGALDMTRYLLSLGHKKIGFIAGRPEHKSSGDRYRGFLKALEESNIPFDRRYHAESDYSFDGGVAAATALLSLPQRPSAIFASNDDMAAGVLAVAHRMNLSVPKELSVAGFDDMPIARQIRPTLSSVHTPLSEIVEEAIGDLISQLENRAPVDAKTKLFPLSLQIRDSTGPVESQKIDRSPEHKALI